MDEANINFSFKSSIWDFQFFLNQSLTKSEFIIATHSDWTCHFSISATSFSPICSKLHVLSRGLHRWGFSSLMIHLSLTAQQYIINIVEIWLISNNQAVCLHQQPPVSPPCLCACVSLSCCLLPVLFNCIGEMHFRFVVFPPHLPLWRYMVLLWIVKVQACG